jgi:flagellar basal body P-ring protein FlgI
MNLVDSKKVWLMAGLIVVCFANGCGGRDQASSKSKQIITEKDLGQTIGSLAEVILPEAIPVEGYGLVGNLYGTGSSECPTQIRAYLKQYILTQLPEQKIDPEKFINSTDTAVVHLEAVIPKGAWKNQDFDVKVTALPGTQTTSLENGWLYRAELKPKGTFRISTKVVAIVEGPVFIDKIDTSNPNTRLGYILGGGRVLDEYGITLVFRGRNYAIANRVRNRLNERFGEGIAKAVSPDRIELIVPAKYKEQKQKFASIVKALYLEDSPDIIDERIDKFVNQLAVLPEGNDSEIALEAIGNASVSELKKLLNSFDEQIRLRAGRCMLNLGSIQGLPTLQEIALNKRSAYRVEALQAIATAARRSDAAAISRRLLRDDDFEIRLAAFEQLHKLDDFAITSKFVGRNFYLEQVARTAQKEVFVSRSGKPKIMLFGAPIYCHDDIFVQSTDGSIALNAPARQKYVSIIRKHPRKLNIILQLRSSFELADIIMTLCEEPLIEDKKGLQGLGVSYTDMIDLLKQMCDKGAISAKFHAGPLPKID